MLNIEFWLFILIIIIIDVVDKLVLLSNLVNEIIEKGSVFVMFEVKVVVFVESFYERYIE